MTTTDLKPDDYPADEFDKGNPAYQLAKLQKQMDALAGVKCPHLTTGTCSPGVNAEIKVCNGSGLDPRYDCLRVKCKGYSLSGNEVHDEHCCGGEFDKGTYNILPAERAHEAVGKLLDMLLWFEMDKSHIRLGLLKGSNRGSSYYQGIVGNLLFALCEAEGVRDG